MNTPTPRAGDRIQPLRHRTDTRTVDLPPAQLRRIRWAVRATLTLGVAASVAANILHARSDPIAQAIAAWPPLALLLTVELISRVPVDRKGLAAARLAATTGIASIAAWVSYHHMAAVAARYGESGASAHLLPLSVDGLVIVASISLVELAGRLRGAHTATPEPATATATAPAHTIDVAVSPAPDPAGPTPTRSADAARARAAGSPPTRAPISGTPRGAASLPAPARPRRPAAAAAGKPPIVAAAPHGQPSDTVAAVAHWRGVDPGMSVRELCARVGRSQRTVRRILDRLTDEHPNRFDTPAAPGRPTVSATSEPTGAPAAR